MMLGGRLLPADCDLLRVPFVSGVRLLFRYPESMERSDNNELRVVIESRWASAVCLPFDETTE